MALMFIIDMEGMITFFIKFYIILYQHASIYILSFNSYIQKKLTSCEKRMIVYAADEKKLL